MQLQTVIQMIQTDTEALWKIYALSSYYQLLKHKFSTMYIPMMTYTTNAQICTRAHLPFFLYRRIWQNWAPCHSTSAGLLENAWYHLQSRVIPLFIPSPESPCRAGGRLSLREGPHSGAAEDCEEEGATEFPSNCAAGKQEVENLCGKSSPGRRERWGGGRCFMICSYFSLSLILLAVNWNDFRKPYLFDCMWL